MSQVISIGARNVMGSESITIDNTSGGIGLTAAKINPAGPAGEGGMNFRPKEAFITVEAQEIRWSIDPAVAPEAAAGGHTAAAGTNFTIHGQQLTNFRAIRTGGSSGTIRVTYFG